MQVSVEIDLDDVLEELSTADLRQALLDRKCDDTGITQRLRDIYADLIVGRTQYAITALDSVIQELK